MPVLLNLDRSPAQKYDTELTKWNTQGFAGERIFCRTAKAGFATIVASSPSTAYPLGSSGRKNGTQCPLQLVQLLHPKFALCEAWGDSS